MNYIQECECGHLETEHYLPSPLSPIQPPYCCWGFGCKCREFKESFYSVALHIRLNTEGSGEEPEAF